MDKNQILDLLKANLGIASNVRDEYLKMIIDGVISELEDNHGVVLEESDTAQIMFVVDYSAWRYRSVDPNNSAKFAGDMPRNLKWRLHNQIIRKGGSR